MYVILSAVLPVLITALAGYGVAKAGKPFDTKTVTFLVANIGTPCLVFLNLSKAHIEPSLMGIMAAATLSAIVFCLLVSTVVLKASNLSLQTYLPSLSLPNTGNLGLPLALYAYGQLGLNYAIVIFAVNAVMNFTVGQAIAAGSAKWHQVWRSPLVWAALLGVAASITEVVLPVWVLNTLTIFSGLTIPLMLLMLGISLATIQVTTFPRAAALSVLRIGMGAAAGFAIAYLFGLTGTARAVFVMQSAMPVAVYNYFWAQIYNNEPGQVASLVVISTLMSVVTIPLLLAILPV